MSFQRRANRVLLIAMPVSLAFLFIGSAIPGVQELFNYDVVLVATTALAACGGLVLPSVTLLLDRVGLLAERAGPGVRRVGIGMGILLASFGALTVGEAGGWGRIAGIALLLFGIAVALLGLTQRVAGISDDGRVFGSTFLGAAVFCLAFLFLSYAFGTRQHAFRTHMAASLRTLASAQEANFDATGVYSADPGVGGTVQPPRYAVRVWLTPDGWAAQSTHPGVPGHCAVYGGSTPAPPAEHPNEVACTQESASRGQTMAALSSSLLAAAALLVLGGVIMARPGPAPRITA